jgi:hypothetical protein
MSPRGGIGSRSFKVPSTTCGAKADAAMHDGGLVSRSASKVNAEIADSAYLPADAAFKNLVQPRDDVLLVVASPRRRSKVPPTSHSHGAPSLGLGGAAAYCPPHSSRHPGGQLENPSHSIFGRVPSCMSHRLLSAIIRRAELCSMPAPSCVPARARSRRVGALGLR